MEDKIFSALIVEETAPNTFHRHLGKKKISDLPKGDIVIEVHYSSLNYKDALSARGHKGITRHYPHTPGIDAAGIVIESKVKNFRPGDKVIVTGYDLGMNTSGGFAEYICVPADWVVPLPANLTLKESMVYGTAGFTAGLCAYEILKKGITPSDGKVLVTGATGGVGSIATALFSHLGFFVTASTGKSEAKDFLQKLGAEEIISREKVFETTGKPLLPRQWIAAVDNIGGTTLSTVIRSIDYDGIVTSVGLVESDKLNITIYPFILRGVSLVGIDSAETKMQKRLEIWQHLATDWKIPQLNSIYREVSLDEINHEIEKILIGKQKGRVLIKIKH
ncbi:MAG: YhdH/YhfP family quinone oxidoreductase [Candidatus Kapaibacteriales bacterium]